MTSFEKSPVLDTTPDARESVDTAGDAPANMQERHPDWPKLDVTFYFSPHDNDEDMRGVADHLQDADVLFIESAATDKRGYAATKRILKAYNKVSSDPKANLKKILYVNDLHGESDEPLMRGVHGTDAVVDTLDIGATEEERRLGAEMAEAMRALQPDGSNYEETLARYSERRKKVAELQAERENMMADKFEGQIERILAGRPDLMGKKEMKVLITMGSAHTTLRHALTRRGVESKQRFSQRKNYIYDYGVELIRTFSYGKEPSEELVKRAFAESIIHRAIERGFMESSIPTDEFMRYTRRYVSELSDEEMEGLFDLWNKHMASTTGINSLLVPAEMPPLAVTVQEIREANALYDDRVHTLGAAAIQH